MRPSLQLPSRYRARSAAAAGAALMLLAGCAGSARTPPPPSVTVQTAPASLPTPAAARADGGLPPLAVTQPAPLSAEPPFRVDVADADLREVVLRLARHFGLDYQVDPSVQGRVSARLSAATPEQALDALVLPHGFGYTLQDNVLRVVPARAQTRIFSLDYIALSRTSFGTTVVQRSIGSQAGGAGGQAGIGGMGGGMGGLGQGSSSVITTAEGANLWQEIQVALEGLIFGTSGTATPAPAAGGAAGGLGAMGGAGMPAGPGAMSRIGEDGRRLLINPMAGTILVSAPPEVLAEVSAFLRAVEGAVQRQVLIEAKIVEVSLNRRSEFGIDWSLLQRVAGVRVNLRSNPQTGTVAMTLDRPDAGDTEADVRVVLTALQQQGEVRVLSSPHVAVLNNQRAMINVATDEVFFAVTREPILGPGGTAVGFSTSIQPQQIAVGISLDVLAQIAPDNTITMNVRPAVTNVVRIEEIRLEDGTLATAPVIDRRETDTVVRVRGGETIMIGGLMQTLREQDRRGVPVLSDIPLLGGLFRGSTRRSEKRELVIFLTPTILAGQPPTGN